MSRCALEIRDARPEDVAGLLQLWTHAGRNEATPRPVDEATRALAQIAADPDERLLVGLVEGEVVAALHLRRAPMSPLHTETAVHTSYLLVLPEHRRHGYARALLDTALSWAEEKDVTHITAITNSNSRDTNRFLARLGLGTAATVRIASTATMRRKLAPEVIRSQDARRQLGRVLAQRRSLQRRAVQAETAQGQVAD
ncbi:GNAT family N-acetyltransferase [Nocardioides pocheonensis]|uniref:GNAT family N-acetyltransferase n=1 Tax=Nocardioides pocheonensis TaxID=661485 RepID=A0A3N0GV53_9ACTN|nr:GNAT family N-acetyltransferase [Nocardioides pocheonensis]RNM16020.1 GNAT family N-acetyltransferase [Nocardioides pocheonensis]